MAMPAPADAGRRLVPMPRLKTLPVGTRVHAPLRLQDGSTQYWAGTITATPSGKTREYHVTFDAPFNQEQVLSITPRSYASPPLPSALFASDRASSASRLPRLALGPAAPSRLPLPRAVAPSPARRRCPRCERGTADAAGPAAGGFAIGAARRRPATAAAHARRARPGGGSRTVRRRICNSIRNSIRNSARICGSPSPCGRCRARRTAGAACRGRFLRCRATCFVTGSAICERRRGAGVRGGGRRPGAAAG